MGRRPPSIVRRAETICRTHQRAVHYVPGVSPGVVAAIIIVEHDRLGPGQVAEELRRWEELARRGVLWRPGAGHCGILGCCGSGPRGFLEEAIRLLPPRARPGLARVVRRVEEIYLRHTQPDPAADPDAPWWERRIRRR